MAGLNRKEITKGMVVVIRYEGPKGGPGMPEMLTPTSAIMGAGNSDFPSLPLQPFTMMSKTMPLLLIFCSILIQDYY